MNTKKNQKIKHTSTKDLFMVYESLRANSSNSSVQVRYKVSTIVDLRQIADKETKKIGA